MSVAEPIGRTKLKYHKDRARRAELDPPQVAYPGDTGDGGLAIFDESGTLLQRSPPAVTAGVRRLVARLEAVERGAMPQIVAITSTLSGEGVTFVSRSLGAVLANDLGKSVVVVELDWALPSDPSESHVGLAQVLSGGSTLDSALVRTGIPGLRLLPAGSTSVSQRPLLARCEALGETIAELRSRFKHIVLDLPAVLATSDALTLATHADAVALVVQQGVTSEPQIKRALSELEHLTVLGVIINQWSSRIPSRILAALSPWVDADNQG